MHTLKLQVQDSIYEKLMNLLHKLPADSLEIIETDSNYPAISMEEAKRNVEEAINNITATSGISLDDAFDQIINTK